MINERQTDRVFESLSEPVSPVGRYVGHYWYITVVAVYNFTVSPLTVTLLFATVGCGCYLQMLLLATHCQGVFIIFYAHFVYSKNTQVN